MFSFFLRCVCAPRCRGVYNPCTCISYRVPRAILVRTGTLHGINIPPAVCARMYVCVCARALVLTALCSLATFAADVLGSWSNQFVRLIRFKVYIAVLAFVVVSIARTAATHRGNYDNTVFFWLGFLCARVHAKHSQHRQHCRDSQHVTRFQPCSLFRFLVCLCVCVL